MIADHERFKNLATGVQSCIVSVGVLVAGTAALYVFVSWWAIEAGSLQRAARDLRSVDVPIVRLDVRTEPVESPDNEYTYVRGVLTASNVGRRGTELKFTRTPIEVFRIDFDEDGETIWNLYQDLPIKLSDKPQVDGLQLELPAGGRSETEFLLRIPDPGVYVVRVYGSPAADDERPPELERKTPYRAHRSAEHFFIVEPPATERAPADAAVPDSADDANAAGSAPEPIEADGAEAGKDATAE